MLLYSALFATVLATAVTAHNSLAVPMRFFGEATQGPLQQGQFPCGVGADGIAGAYKSAKNAGQYKAGGTIDVQYSSATYHDGGSCQFSVSGDEGVTWKVLLSIEGKCPTSPNEQVPIPSAFPSGDYIFSWSWVPYSSGVPEFYHACSKISIEGSGSQSDLNALPDMFVAIVNECKVDASSGHTQVVFPNPGKQVDVRSPSLQGKSPGFGLVPGSCGSQSSGASPPSDSTKYTNDRSGENYPGAPKPHVKAAAIQDEKESTSAKGSDNDSKSDAPANGDSGRTKTSTAKEGSGNDSGSYTPPKSDSPKKTETKVPNKVLASNNGGGGCDSAWTACNAAWQAAGSTGAYTCQTEFVACNGAKAMRRHRRSPNRQKFQ